MPTEPVKSRFVTEWEFAGLYAAAEFAAAYDLWLDTSLTVVWRLLGPDAEADPQAAFLSLTKCIRDWLAQRALPIAYLYSHEHAPTVGTHTHIALYLPGKPSSHRSDFRTWARGWAFRQLGQHAPRALRVRGQSKETPWLHWLIFSYLVKGYDLDAVVMSRRNAPNGREVRLGDLIAWPWVDPGPVGLRQRVGCSRSLGPDRRTIGVPDGLDEVRPKKFVVDPFDRSPRAARLPPQYLPIPAFRSSYEDGARDIRRLYPPEFHERVTRHVSLSP